MPTLSAAAYAAAAEAARRALPVLMAKGHAYEAASLLARLERYRALSRQCQDNAVASGL